MPVMKREWNRPTRRKRMELGVAEHRETRGTVDPGRRTMSVCQPRCLICQSRRLMSTRMQEASRRRVYVTLIGIATPRASAVLGMTTRSTPFLKVAVTLVASTWAGSLRLRANDP